MLRLVLALTVAIAATSATPARAAVVCCTASEIQVLGDINYTARVVLGHIGDASARLYTLAMQLKAGTWRQWSDPDRGYILGLMAATDHYKNDAGNRAIVDGFAADIGVVIKQVSLPAPPVVVPPAPPPVVQPAPAPAPAPAPIPAGGIEAEIRRIVQDELTRVRTIRADSLILGKGCPTDASAILQLCAPGGAAIAGFSNLNGEWYQSAKPHAFTIDFSGDGGGPRLIQNGYGTTQCFDDVDPTNGVHYQNCMKRHVDDTKPYTAIGTDSWGNFSWIRSMKGQARDYTQDVVLVIDPDRKIISLESWQTGWHWEFVRSSCRACRDIRMPVQ
jgi:hypothetical protein